jgi:hypothetical protein
LSSWHHLAQGTHLVMQKPQVWSSSKERDATAWQRHVERRATMEMGRNCGFWGHDGHDVG